MAVFGNFGKVYFEKYNKYGSLWKFWKSLFRKSILNMAVFAIFGKVY